MSWFGKFLPKEASKEEYFITLGVEEHRIRAAVASIKGHSVSIVGSGESEFSEGENETEAADIAISTAEKNLGEKTLVQKVVFALPQVYLENDKVKPEYRARLQKITRELDLKPSGFIEYPAAISFFLEREEGSPPTLILLSVGRTHLTVSLIRVGRVQQNLTIPKSESILTDIESALPDLQAEILPSRILLYDESDKLEKIREELLRFSWHKHSSFLHTPKIEILPNQKILTAIVEAAGSSFIPSQSQVKDLQMEEEKEVKPGKVQDLEKEKKETEEKETVLHKEAETKEVQVEEELKITEEEDFGFVQETETQHKNIKHPKHPPILVTEQEEIKEDITIDNKKSLSLPKFSFSFPKFPSLSVNLFLFILSIFIAGGFIVGAIWIYPKATVGLIVYPLTASTQADITLTTNSSDVKPDKNIILANNLTIEVSGQKSIPTTGKTNVGEKAKGEVTIYNKTVNSKTIPKGSVLQNGDLKFTLNEDVSIASASDTGEGLTFGKTNTPAIATSIGPESNLTTGSILTFKDFPESSYTAKTLSGFSGGTSREVSSVAREDQNKLETTLTEELLSQAKQQLVLKVQTGEKLLEGTISKSIVSSKFSSDVGGEAKELSLSMTLKINAYSFRDEQLSNLAAQTITLLPTGFTLDTNRTGIKIDQVKTNQKDGTITAKATITANFWPQLDQENIKKSLIGKSYVQAADYLKTVEQVGGIRITIDKKLPLLNNLLPLSSDNLTLIVVSI